VLGPIPSRCSLSLLFCGAVPNSGFAGIRRFSDATPTKSCRTYFRIVSRVGSESGLIRSEILLNSSTWAGSVTSDINVFQENEEMFS
jgi:hypothetical protein